VQKFFPVADKNHMGQKRRWRLGDVAFKGVLGLSATSLSMNRFERDMGEWMRSEAEEYSAMLEAQHRAEGLHAFLPEGPDGTELGVDEDPLVAACAQSNVSIQGGDDWSDDGEVSTAFLQSSGDGAAQPLL
jgi:hypothetical protein